MANLPIKSDQSETPVEKLQRHDVAIELQQEQNEDQLAFNKFIQDQLDKEREERKALAEEFRKDKLALTTWLQVCRFFGRWAWRGLIYGCVAVGGWAWTHRDELQLFARPPDQK